MSRLPTLGLLATVGCGLLWPPLTKTLAQDLPDPNEPKIEEASREASLALEGFEIADGISGNLFAAEPLFANPVAFFVSDRGAVYVCETFRQGIGVVDNRDFSQEWVDADLASQTVEDRRQYHLEQLTPEQVKRFMEEDDQIRKLIDTDGDGVADESHVYANRFNGLVDGTGAGVLEYRGNVYYTCIPSLYLMRDEDGDHQSDGRTTLYSGFGIRVAFRGHDLHGLTIGPDGRLYFSIGDRGTHVETPDGTVSNIESGSVFRCELDGSGLQLFATGLRNPQELAFDNYGRLFTGDNNSDSGDQARWVYVVEGGDSGWRMPYQYLSDRGPFNREKLWEPYHEGQPSYIVPPIANISDGPSGLDFYPGTGFGDRFADQFFLADFRGTASMSGIRAIKNEPDGAFFKIAEDSQPFWNILATDLQFGPDGALYVSDWVNGWEGEGKGRIYRFAADQQDEALVQEVQNILAADIGEADSETLQKRLGHVDRRIRLNAQLELATRGETDLLYQVAVAGSTKLERLHGVWGLDHLARLHPEQRPAAVSTFVALASDSDPDIRENAIRLVGEYKAGRAETLLSAALDDANPRVRYQALMGVYRTASRALFSKVLAALVENEGRDPILRHGGIMALTTAGSAQQLSELSGHNSLDVRLAAVVALRKLKSPLVAQFLADPEEQVVAEAARAIHDAPIDDAMASLAELIANKMESPSLIRRVLDANFRVGNAAAMAEFAADETREQSMRLEALKMLGDWETPSGRDRVTGMWRPLPSRDVATVQAALESVLTKFSEADLELQLEIARLAGTYKLGSAADLLKGILSNSSVRATVRAAALNSLAAIDAATMAEVKAGLESDSVELRSAALQVLGQVSPDMALQEWEKAALTGEVGERQVAIKLLAGLSDVNEALVNVLQGWAGGDLPNEVQLEALQAAEKHAGGNEQIAAILEQVNASRDLSVPADAYRETLFGGDRRAGRTVFFEKVSVSCVRCHQVYGQGGEVGPELSRIGADKTREYLLESLVDPNKTIAKGFESAVLLDLDGNIHTGVVREETDDSITLIDAEGQISTFDKDDIEARNPALSGMPADLVKNLSKEEIRDLVEYLSSLNGRFFRPRREVQ